MYSCLLVFVMCVLMSFVDCSVYEYQFSVSISFVNFIVGWRVFIFEMYNHNYYVYF